MTVEKRINIMEPISFLQIKSIANPTWCYICCAGSFSAYLKPKDALRFYSLSTLVLDISIPWCHKNASVSWVTTCAVGNEIQARYAIQQIGLYRRRKLQLWFICLTSMHTHSSMLIIYNRICSLIIAKNWHHRREDCSLYFQVFVQHLSELVKIDLPNVHWILTIQKYLLLNKTRTSSSDIWRRIWNIFYWI